MPPTCFLGKGTWLGEEFGNGTGDLVLTWILDNMWQSDGGSGVRGSSKKWLELRKLEF